MKQDLTIFRLELDQET